MAKNYDEMNLEELNIEIQTAQNAKDEAVKFLKMLMSKRDKFIAEQSVKDIVDSLSEDQKLAMYAQIVGVKAAKSGAIAVNAKDNK